MASIEIDGKKYDVDPGKMIIEVADEHGVSIPRFCYHKKLSIAANCRMCLVEVEKSGKPLPACATPVTDGMKVHTKSPKALDAQKSVMEFLLINHPLDCPICDQGGECELQDVSMGYGKDLSRYTEGKRSVHDKNLGPLIATEMTRCIHCTRCVRFGAEVDGLRELGQTSRGENSEIGTFIEQNMQSEMSGNVIDLCPVGALTSKPFRFTARAWELTEHATIAPHDCLGSNILVHTRRGEVMRVVPKDNEEINETWISDRDRFSYAGLTSSDRIETPMIKRDGQWQSCDWLEALNEVRDNLTALIKQHGASCVGGLATPSATIEELYLLQKILRQLGSSNIDHRLRWTDFSDQEDAALHPDFAISISELDKQNAVLLVGCNIRWEAPTLAVRLRKASLAGAKVMAINPVDHDFYLELSEKEIVSPSLMIESLAAIAKVLVSAENKLPVDLAKIVEKVTPTKTHQAMAKHLKENQKAFILLGAYGLQHPHAAVLRALINCIATFSGARIGMLTEGANSAGAWLAGAVPHRGPAGKKSDVSGKNVREMLASETKAYLLLNVEPTLDMANPAQTLQALKSADFVVAVAPFRNEALLEVAHVILPNVPFTETAGTYVNVAGRWQSFNGVARPLAQARPGWKILRVLGNQLALDGFDYASSTDVLDELKALCEKAESAQAKNTSVSILPEENISGLTRITQWPIYAGDSLVRRALPLQQTALTKAPAAYVNSQVAQQLKLIPGSKVVVSQNKHEVLLPVVIDERIADQCVYIPAGYQETAGLGDSFGAIEIKNT